MLGAAVIGGVTSYMGSREQASAAGQAGELQARGAAAANELSFAAYSQAREDTAPYREVGEVALGQYAALSGVGREGMLTPAEMEDARGRFMETPGYQFRVGEGIKALDRSASAKGRLQGGGYGRELIRYGQGVASQEYENYANRLASLVSVGQGATQSMATLGANTAATQGNISMASAQGQGSAMMDAATARASGYTGVANAASGAISNYMLYNYMNKGAA